MTKQEEIREWLEHNFHETNARVILDYLHSQGVVIKVKCPYCAWSSFEDEPVGMTPCEYCNSTGYVIEPLIKED